MSTSALSSALLLALVLQGEPFVHPVRAEGALLHHADALGVGGGAVYGRVAHTYADIGTLRRRYPQGSRAVNLAALL